MLELLRAAADPRRLGAAELETAVRSRGVTAHDDNIGESERRRHAALAEEPRDLWDCQCSADSPTPRGSSFMQGAGESAPSQTSEEAPQGHLPQAVT